MYTDFSSPCLDGLHTMILGGSFMSTGDEASVLSLPEDAAESSGYLFSRDVTLIGGNRDLDRRGT